MSQNKIALPPPLSTPPALKKAQYSRALAYLLMAGSVLAGIYVEHFALPLLWLAGYAVVYPHLAHWVSRRLKHIPREKIRTTLFVLDAINVGVASALMGFSLVPAIMLALCLSFNALIVGGLRLFYLTTMVTLSTALLAGVILQPVINLNSPPFLTLTCLSSCGLYVCLGAYAVHQQGNGLISAQLDIQREREKAEQLAQGLAKYLSPQVWDSIFNGKKSVRLETQRKKLTVFFSDIKGFTELSEELEAESLTDLLNTYLNEMSKLALKHGGTIDKFVGDSIMVFFGDPNTQGARKDAQNAVSMAIAMRKHMKVLRQQWRAQGITRPLEVRMGLNTGYCTVGNFGADTRMDYTIIGREVNLASRLESAADAGEILISHETYSLVKDTVMCRDKGQIGVRGFSRPVQIYQVVDLRRDLGAESSYVEHELPGFSMYLDTNGIEYQDREKIADALDQAAQRLRDEMVV